MMFSAIPRRTRRGKRRSGSEVSAEPRGRRGFRVPALFLAAVLTFATVAAVRPAFAFGQTDRAVDWSSVAVNAGWASLWILLLLIDFFSLAVVCDAHLVPAIEVICERWKIPDAVAGASFLAFGSSAPEVMINAAAVAQPEPKIEMSLPAMFGSAMIAFGLIPALCTFVVQGQLELDPVPIARDTVCYALSLLLLISILQDGEVTWKDAAFLVLAFIVYMFILAVPLCFASEEEAEGEELEASMSVMRPASPLGVPDLGSVNKAPVKHHSHLSRQMSLKQFSPFRTSFIAPGGSVLARRGSSFLSRRESTHHLSPSNRGDASRYGSIPHAVEGGETPRRSQASTQGEDEEETTCLGRMCEAIMEPVEAIWDKLMLKCVFDLEPGRHNLVIDSTPTGGGVRAFEKEYGITIDRDDLKITSVTPGGKADQAFLKVGWRLAKIFDPSMPAEEDEDEEDALIDDVDQFKEEFDKANAMDVIEFHEPPSSCMVAIVFLLALVYVSALSSVALTFTQNLTVAICMPQTLAGATLLALGAQVPDTVGSISMAKAGLADGAVANAIGSQLINVSLGVGLPFLLYDLTRHKNIKVDAGDLTSLLSMGACLTGLIIIYLCCCLWKYVTCRASEQIIIITEAAFRAVKFESPAPASPDGNWKIARVSEVSDETAKLGLGIGITIAEMHTEKTADYVRLDGDKPYRLLDGGKTGSSSPRGHGDKVYLKVMRKGGLHRSSSGIILIVSFFLAFTIFVAVDVGGRLGEESSCGN
eukprot:Hpha_TRINITY_DN16789_c0_g4::TRINITY_DN16789_c0_g4_i1::g.80391::m.80391